MNYETNNWNLWTIREHVAGIELIGNDNNILFLSFKELEGITKFYSKWKKQTKFKFPATKEEKSK